MKRRDQLPAAALEWAANDPARRKVKWNNWEPGLVTCSWRYGKIHRRRLVAERVWPADATPATAADIHLAMRDRAIADLDYAVCQAEDAVVRMQGELAARKKWRAMALAAMEQAL